MYNGIGMEKFKNPSFEAMWDGETAFPVAFLYDARIPAEAGNEPENQFQGWHQSLLLLLRELERAL